MTTIEEQVRLYAAAITVDEPAWSAAADLRAVASSSDEVDFGSESIFRSERRRSASSRSAWLVAAAVMVLAVGATALLVVRADRNRTSPPPSTESIPTVPVTQPASVYPTNGDWELIGLGYGSEVDQSAWRYSLSVHDEQGRPMFIHVSTTVPGESADRGERVELNGQSVLIRTLNGDSDHPQFTWEPVPGTTVTSGSPQGVASRDDAIDSFSWMITNGLEVDTSDAFHRQVAARFPDALLTLGGTATALREIVPSNGEFTGASQLIFVPGHQWGAVSLSVAAAEYAPPGTTSAPITIRGVSGEEVVSSVDTGDLPYLRWSEGGYQYTLRYASTITTSEAVDLANSLHVADQAETASMLFPDWAPALNR